MYKRPTTQSGASSSSSHMIASSFMFSYISKSGSLGGSILSHVCSILDRSQTDAGPTQRTIHPPIHTYSRLRTTSWPNLTNCMSLGCMRKLDDLWDKFRGATLCDHVHGKSPWIFYVVARVTFVSLTYQTRTPNTQWDGSRLELCFGLLFDFLSFVHLAKFRH